MDRIVNFRATSELVTALQEGASAQGIPLSHFIRETLIREVLDRDIDDPIDGTRLVEGNVEPKFSEAV